MPVLTAEMAIRVRDGRDYGIGEQKDCERGIEGDRGLKDDEMKNETENQTKVDLQALHPISALHSSGSC